MTTQLGGFGTPGMGSLELSTPRELLWGGDNRSIMALWINAQVSGATRDAGNTPTTVLRGGLVLGKITSSKKMVQWVPTATDGSQDIAGILDVSNLKATDYNASDADRWLRVLVRGPVLASQLLLNGTTLVGHAWEYLARRQMVQSGFIFDDDPFGTLAGKGRAPSYKTTAFSVLATDNGMTFYVGGALIATLPTIKAGLEYKFVGVADVNWQVKSAEGDNIVVLNDAEADAINFTTSTQKIGAVAILRSDYVNGVLKWVSEENVGTQTIYT
jgi:hypothetical protein